MGCLVFVSLWPGSGSFTARLAVFSRDSHGSLPSLDTSAASHQQNTQIWPDKTGIEIFSDCCEIFSEMDFPLVGLFSLQQQCENPVAVTELPHAEKY